MTNAEFRTKLSKAFKNHPLMGYRNKHTINELLYILEHDDAFEGNDYNISIIRIEGGCFCIPSLEAFVNTQSRGIWFEDNEVAFEVDEFEDVKFNCITIYESEEK